ncbi:DUF58 domain-containing protein [Akkermansiaceae bacterium]|nr:DUF58 domain-containing protein [Akkermansiaceae bacterium]
MSEQIMPPLNKEEIFDPAFLASLSHLRVVARRVPRDGRFAEQRSHDLGHGTDFRDFRPYAAGDDFRSIDWNIYQRLGRVFLRLYEELEDLPLYLMPDISRSLFLESPPRALASLRTTLALASISLNHHDSTGLFPFSDDCKVLARPQTGRGKVMHFADRLAQLEPGGATDIRAAIKRFNSFGLRRGLLVVVSDFFDPGGIGAVVSALKQVRHNLLLVQLHRRSDAQPDLRGDVRLIDCESREAEDLSITPALIKRYREVYDQFQADLAGFAKSRNAGLLRIDVDEEIVPQLAGIFEGGRYVV